MRFGWVDEMWLRHKDADVGDIMMRTLSALRHADSPKSMMYLVSSFRGSRYGVIVGSNRAVHSMICWIVPLWRFAGVILDIELDTYPIRRILLRLNSTGRSYRNKTDEVPQGLACLMKCFLAAAQVVQIIGPSVCVKW